MNEKAVALLFLIELIEMAEKFLDPKREELLTHAATAWDEWVAL